MSIRHRRVAAIAGTAVLATVSVGLSAATFSQWSTPVSAENPAAFPGTGDVNKPDKTDGCPILDPYTNDLFIARESDQVDLDIWRAPWSGKSWGDPVTLGAPVNTADDEFCPSPARGNRLFFVRRPKGTPDGDIWFARAKNDGFDSPQRLPTPINSTGQEWSPSYYEEPDGAPVLYFSSTRDGTHDICFRQPATVTPLSSAVSKGLVEVRLIQRGFRAGAASAWAGKATLGRRAIYIACPPSINHSCLAGSQHGSADFRSRRVV